MGADRWAHGGESSDRELNALARLIPKCELHTHLEGSIRADTALELGGRRDIDLGVEDPDALYEYSDLIGFLRALGAVNSVLLEAADFERVIYESGEDAVRAGVRYREVFFTPGYHVGRGVPLDRMWQGVVAGATAAEADFGIRSRFVVDIRRTMGKDHANQVAAWAVRNKSEYLVGLGADDVESTIDHAIFVDAYKAAMSAGLHRCLHAGEEGPVDTIRFGLDNLGLERIDHGMRLFDDPEVAGRVIRNQVPITACPTSNVLIGICRDVASHPVGRQIREGALVTVNSDNPCAFRIDAASEFAAVVSAHGLGFDGLRTLSLNSVESTFLVESEKAHLRAEFESECDTLLRTAAATGEYP